MAYARGGIASLAWGRGFLVVLAQCGAQQSDISAALQVYDKRRIPRTTAIARHSRRLHCLILCPNRLLCSCRDTLVAYLSPMIRHR
jgi:2-polyprenyl-6-methoxyphenol hydroxylase-like FAD-dependent oxidoreductase